MKKYSYPFTTAFVKKGSLIIVYLYPLVIILAWSWIIQLGGIDTLVAQLWLIFGWFALVYIAGNYPDIYLDGENGIMVQFLFLRLRLSWNDITGIKEFRLPFGRWNFWVVKTTKLTPFHFLYGLGGWSLSRAFYFTHEIENYPELISLFSTHIRK